MAKKEYETRFEEIVDNFYYFLKNKLNFNDIQAFTLMASIALIPVSLLFGFYYYRIETFKMLFYTIIGLDIIVIIYSIIKFKMSKNQRIIFLKKLENKTIEINDIEDVNNLNPVEFEYFVKEYFVFQGYKAWTTQKTHDNGADVIAEKGKERVAIQVKHSIKKINGYGIYQTERGKQNYRADMAILITNNDFSNQAINDAKRLNIKLISGHDISYFLRKNGSITINYKNNSIH